MPPIPALPLALPYTSRLCVKGYWIFEKIDGIRAFWDTHSLVTRSGALLPLNLSLPSSSCLDGELFAGSFERTIQALKSGNMADCEFRIFDAWNSETLSLPFSARFRLLSTMTFENPHCSVLPCLGQVGEGDSESVLDRKLSEIVSGGGEGLILRDPDAPVTAGRTESLIKMKGFFDADGVVVEQTVSRVGNSFGRVASLVVLDEQTGNRIKVGSGLSELLRVFPPPIGSRISYGWKQTFASSGLPKCPFFIRQLS